MSLTTHFKRVRLSPHYTSSHYGIFRSKFPFHLYPIETTDFLLFSIISLEYRPRRAGRPEVSQAFHALTQMSPNDYVRHTRLNAAKTLLTTTDRRITDIAMEVGFYDHAHFIRTFRAATSLTPSRYRAQTSGRAARTP